MVALSKMAAYLMFLPIRILVPSYLVLVDKYYVCLSVTVHVSQLESVAYADLLVYFLLAEIWFAGLDRAD